MPDTTTLFGFPYPEPTDPTDVPGDIEALAEGVETSLNAHMIDATDAHDASAISTTALTGISATNVQAVLAELIAETFPQGWGAWASYVPTWTSTGTNPAIGNGTISGAWTKIGRTVHYAIQMTTGTTSTYGTGVYLWSLPTAGVAGNRPGSNCYIVDASAGTQLPRAVRQNSSTVVFALAENGTFVGPTAPMTWATGDSISIAGTYEATT